MRDTFVRTLIEIAKADKDVHLLTGDLGFGVLKPYWEQLPEQFTNVGIAEQNMTGIAAGMALSGKKVFTYLSVISPLCAVWNRLGMIVLIMMLM